MQRLSPSLNTPSPRAASSAANTNSTLPLEGRIAHEDSGGISNDHVEEIRLDDGVAPVARGDKPLAGEAAHRHNTWNPLDPSSRRGSSESVHQPAPPAANASDPAAADGSPVKVTLPSVPLRDVSGTTQYFTIPIALAVAAVAAAVIAASGFPHLAIMRPYNAHPMESEGINTYRNILFVEGISVVDKFLNELSGITSIGKLGYITNFATFPYAPSDPQDNATWDIALHKWFLSLSQLHPERRMFYVDYGSLKWTGQPLRGPLGTRIVGDFMPLATRYDPVSLPGEAMRYVANGTYSELIYSPVQTSNFFLSVGQPVWLTYPFVDHEGLMSYGYGMVMFDTSLFRLQGLLMMLIPLENFLDTPAYAKPTSCSTASCSATFDQSGALIATTHPAILSVYAEASLPGAVCTSDWTATHTCCRHSIATVSAQWSTLAALFVQYPNIVQAGYVSFGFEDGGAQYLATSTTFNVSGNILFTVDIAPASSIVGTYFESRKRVTFTVVAAGIVGSLLAAILVVALLQQLSISLEDMRIALALRPRKSQESDFEKRLRERGRQWFGFTDVRELDEAIVVIQRHIDSLGSLLPPAVIGWMRHRVTKLRRKRRQTINAWWGRWLAALFQHEDTDADSMASEAQGSDEEHDDASQQGSQESVEREVEAASRFGNIPLPLDSPPPARSDEASPTVTEDQRALSADTMDFDFAKNDSFSSVGSGPTSDPEDAATSPKRGILVASTINTKTSRTRGVFLSVSLSNLEFRAPTDVERRLDFTKLIARYIETVWSFGGDVELVTAQRFIVSFNCYDAVANPDESACRCALQLFRDTHFVVPHGRMHGNLGIVVDAGWFEAVTLVSRGRGSEVIRRKLIKTAAFQSAERLNDLCDAFHELLVVTADVRKYVPSLVTTAADSIRFSPTRLARLFRRGALQIFRVELKSTIGAIPLKMIRVHMDNVIKLMMLGEYDKAFSLVNQQIILVSSPAARRFLIVCKAHMHKAEQEQRGRQPGSASATKKLHYFRSEMLNWEIFPTEIAEYESHQEEAKGATRRGLFGDDEVQIL